MDAWFIDMYEQPMITDWDKKSMKRLKCDSGKLLEKILIQQKIRNKK